MLRTYLASLLRLPSLIVLAVLVVLSVVLWLFGDGISLWGATPFARSGTRLGIVITLFAAYFLITFLRHALARRANAKLINSMLANDELVSMGSDLSSDEVGVIRERFEGALKTLRDNPLDGKKRRNYLFELPWYVIIGPPGTGKTTILRNSGLDFPLAGEGQGALQGIGGTRNCDWWISDEAVLIDTAGRYTTQDVNEGVDAAAWSGFLGLLKQHRRRRPLNGVLIAVSMADVAMASEDERNRQAETLRARLRELHRAFGMRLPVYLLFTKCDLIAGFEEYFEDTDAAEREQVWGITLPFDDEQVTYGALFENGFLDLVSRLERRLPAKLGEERNNTRRCRIYSFPHEFGSLATVLRGFVSDVFRVNRYEAQPLLRGIYFTSGTQEGTPFDRLLGAMSRSFSLTPGRQPPLSGQGKAFFIKKTLTDIVFAEKNLVGGNKAVERRLAGAYTAAYAAAVVLALGLSAYWLYGLRQSRVMLADVRTQTDRLSAQLEVADRNRGDLEAILPALDRAGDLRQAVAAPGGWRYLGFLTIDPREELGPAAQQTYDDVLEEYLLPTLTARLQSKLRLMSSAAESDNALLRDDLQTYLMLTTGENYQADEVRREFVSQANAGFPLDPEDRGRMVEHMEKLTSLLPKASSGDPSTIRAARSRLSEIPQAEDIYSRIVSDARRGNGPQPVSIVNLLGGGVLRANTAQQGGQNVVPGLYTRDGFYNFFLARLPQYIRSSTRTDWVLGDGGISDEAYDELAKKVVDRYVQDYVSAWQGAVRQVQVIDIGSLRRAEDVLQVLSQPSSPLTKLLTTLRENTQLPIPGGSGNGSGATAEAAGGMPQVANAAEAAQTTGGVAGKAANALKSSAISTALGDAPWPGNTIAAAFRPLTSLVDPAGNADSLNNVQRLFGDLFGTVSGISSAPQPDVAAFEFVSERARNPVSSSFSQLRTEGSTKPDPVRSLVRSVADRVWQLLMQRSHHRINTLWQQQVVPACNAILDGRYPFEPASGQSVSLEDFSDLFKPAGVIDTFFSENLDPFVTVSSGRFAETPIQDISLGLSQESLAQFTRARAIRSAFFGEGGTTPEATFTVQPEFLDPEALRATFALDDTELVYRHGPIRAKQFTWPGAGGASVAKLRITPIDGRRESIDRKGPWAIFRLLTESGLSSSRGQDQFVFSITSGEMRASFRLSADSVNNPFNLGLYSDFRCPAAI